jgi:RNA polymerase sigma-70 factor, ECF subfamily
MRCMEESDESIRRAVLSGDREAYRLLVARHSQAVFRVAFRVTGNETDAEEAVQETFLKAYQQLANFAGRSSMATWFYRIAANSSLDIVARRKPAWTIGEEDDREQQQIQVPDGKADPERLLISREIEAAQLEAMRALTPLEQTAFALRHIEECSTEEIADALNIAPNAAKQAVFRAVKKMRRQLAPLWMNS